jgi:hypothetical protein
MSSFASFRDLEARLAALGCRRIYFKRLAENDNSKQQIYLGGSFEVLTLLPFGEVRSDSSAKRPNFKAPVYLFWIDANGAAERAPGAQLILYPKYPEVRLSGFLAGCSTAPASDLRHLGALDRAHNNGPDGRVLFFGVDDSSRIFAYLAKRSSALAREVEEGVERNLATPKGVLWEFHQRGNSRDRLLERLAEIRKAGWHSGMRLNSRGALIPYAAQNGGGYTLEALFGITPNARSEPDFEGWELKAYSRDKITLMTPEPDGGYYALAGVERFVRKYGVSLDRDRMYFRGLHRFGVQCPATNMTLCLAGFNATSGKMEGVEGGIELRDERGELGAKWSFSRLIEHWGRKHAAAAFVRYEARTVPSRAYKYLSPVLLGEGAELNRYLLQIARNCVFYDPGCKIEQASGRVRTKARSQFRIHVSQLASLYERFERVDY